MSHHDEDDSSWDQISGAGSDMPGWDLISVVSDVESVASFFAGNTTSYRDALLKEGLPPSSSAGESMEGTADRTKLGFRTLGCGPRTLRDGTSDDDLLLEIEEEHYEVEKPMASKLRRKHTISGRRKCLRGHTGRFNPNSTGLREQTEMTLEVVPSDQAERNKEEHLSALEIGFGRKGRDKVWNLNKGKAWDLVPAILEEESFEQLDQKRMPSSNRGGSEYRPVSSFKLNVLSTKTKVKGKEEAAFHRDAERRKNTIYFKPARRTMSTTVDRPKQIFAQLTRDTPSNVEGEPLPWTLNQMNRRLPSGGTLGKRQTPGLHRYFALFVEDMPILKGKKGGQRYVDIDLGQQRAVTAISTQGGPPPVRRYPIFKDIAAFPDADSERTWARSYKGPFWKVYDPDMKGEARKKQQQWVRSYELQWRAAGGRTWESLGVFRGNSDTTTEKANSLVEFGNAIQCRYLRLIPISCEGKGALRLGFYGRKAVSSERRQQAVISLPSSSPDDQVEYRLYHPSTLLAPHCDQRDCGNTNGYHWWDDSIYCAHKRRRELRAQAKRASNNGVE